MAAFKGQTHCLLPVDVGNDPSLIQVAEGQALVSGDVEVVRIEIIRKRPYQVLNGYYHAVVILYELDNSI